MTDAMTVGGSPAALTGTGVRGNRLSRAGGPAGVRRYAVYLSDFSALGGTAALLNQAAAADGACGGRRVARYVDSGLPDGSPELGPAFHALLLDAAAARFEAVAVSEVSRLAPRDAGVRMALASLLRLGVQVRTPTGHASRTQVRGRRRIVERGVVA